MFIKHRYGLQPGLVAKSRRLTCKQQYSIIMTIQLGSHVIYIIPNNFKITKNNRSTHKLFEPSHERRFSQVWRGSTSLVVYSTSTTSSSSLFSSSPSSGSAAAISTAECSGAVPSMTASSATSGFSSSASNGSAALGSMSSPHASS